MPTALELAVQLSPGCKLQDEVHTRGIVEVAIESQDVRMPVGKSGPLDILTIISNMYGLPKLNCYSLL